MPHGLCFIRCSSKHTWNCILPFVFCKDTMFVAEIYAEYFNLFSIQVHNFKL